MDTFLEKARRLRGSFPVPVLLTMILVIGVLYWAKAVLIPIALATLLTFVLTPIVNVLRRRGLGRTPAVLVTVLLVFALAAAVGGMIVVEVRAFANELPSYRQNIREKIAAVRIASKGGAIEKVQETVNEVMDELNRGDPAQPRDSGAVPVVITGEKAPPNAAVPLVSSLIEPLATAALVIALAVFMLLRREDLRDRILRLAGYGRLAATTRTIDEAGRQVSRYLLRQFILNGAFGICLGICLFFIGLPYAVLWGFVGGLARYIPYVGPWIGAAAPLITSLAVYDTWTTPLMILALVIALELVWGMALEPLLYGQSIGASEVALLIMMAYWTWLWGPVGLLLAGPLTVCVMVIAKSVPGLEFINLLLSREPALDPHYGFYQRLLAKDPDEAGEIARTYLQEHTPEELFQNVCVPTLVACRRDFDRERLNEEDRESVLQALRQIIDDTQSPPPSIPASASEVAPASEPAEIRPLILSCPAHGESDFLALEMFAKCLDPEEGEMRLLSRRRLMESPFSDLLGGRRVVILVASLPDRPLFHLRRLCQRLRLRFAGVPILIAAWGAKDRDRALQQLPGMVDAVFVSFAETRKYLADIRNAPPAEEADRRTRKTSVPASEPILRTAQRFT
jgi:predicted PurR-regulated permease PerM